MKNFKRILSDIFAYTTNIIMWIFWFILISTSNNGIVILDFNRYGEMIYEIIMLIILIIVSLIIYMIKIKKIFF